MVVGRALAYLFWGEWSQKGRLAYSVWMRVRVLYFGVLKDVMGRRSAEMELAEGSSVAELLAVHRSSGRAADSVWDSIAVAVNQEYAQAGDVLKDGDEVALLPPVSGGYGKDQKQSEIQGSFPIRLRSGSGWQGFGVDRGKGRNAGRDY
jgi:molybdopterin converting factor subunit 1